MSESELGIININSVLRDDELRLILWKLEKEESKEVFSLVCKRWLRIQSSDRVRLCARAGPHMLLRLGKRFTSLNHLDLSQSCSRSFYPGLTDYDLQVISTHFPNLHKLFLQNCTGTNINSVLRDDELRLILYKLEQEEAKGVFSLVCKHWLQIQSSDRVRLCARAGPHMLVRLGKRYTRLSHLDLSQSCSRSFYPGLTDNDLQVISTHFSELRKLFLQNCTGATRRRKVVFSTDESQEKRSSGTKYGIVAILVIRLIRGNSLHQRQTSRPTNMSSAKIGWYLLPESPYVSNH